MPHGRLHKRPRVEHLRHSRLAAGRVVAVCERSEREQGEVLDEGHHQSELALVHRDPSSHLVECEAEHGTVLGMDRETERSPRGPSREGFPEDRDVRVVVTEKPHVDRLEQAPDHGCGRAGRCGFPAGMHTL